MRRATSDYSGAVMLVSVVVAVVLVAVIVAFMAVIVFQARRAGESPVQ